MKKLVEKNAKIGIYLGLGSLLAISILGGCIFGSLRTYANAEVPLTYTAPGDKIVVAVHDQRDYIVSGETAPNYVGQTRGKFGIPYHRHTYSGLPLAHDMGKSICLSLKKAGFQTVHVLLDPKESHASAVAKMQKAQTPRMLLLVIKGWMYDKYRSHSYNISYDLVLQVLDDQGTKRAEASVDHDGQVSQDSRIIFHEQLSKLLNNLDIDNNLH